MHLKILVCRRACGPWFLLRVAVAISVLSVFHTHFDECSTKTLLVHANHGFIGHVESVLDISRFLHLPSVEGIVFYVRVCQVNFIWTASIEQLTLAEALRRRIRTGALLRLSISEAVVFHLLRRTYIGPPCQP